MIGYVQIEARGFEIGVAGRQVKVLIESWSQFSHRVNADEKVSQEKDGHRNREQPLSLLAVGAVAIIFASQDLS